MRLFPGFVFQRRIGGRLFPGVMQKLLPGGLAPIGIFRGSNFISCQNLRSRNLLRVNQLGDNLYILDFPVLNTGFDMKAIIVLLFLALTIP